MHTHTYTERIALLGNWFKRYMYNEELQKSASESRNNELYLVVIWNFWICEYNIWDSIACSFSEVEGMWNQTADAEWKSLVNYLKALHIWKESWGNQPKTQWYRKQSQIYSMGGLVAHGSEISTLGGAITKNQEYLWCEIRKSTPKQLEGTCSSGVAVYWPCREE